MCKIIIIAGFTRRNAYILPFMNKSPLFKTISIRSIIVSSLVGLLVNASLVYADPYRVAVIIPSSGPVASLGSYVANGIKLAEKDANEKNILKLTWEDDQFDQVKTLSSYRHISTTVGIDAVLVMASPPANVLAPIVEKSKQILVTIGASDPTIVKDRKYSFIHWVTPSVLGKTLSDELARRDYKKIAFVTSEASGTIADTDATITEIKNLNRQDRVIFNENFKSGEVDFRSAITKLRSLDVDAVVLVLFPGSLSSFAKQSKELGLKAELVGMESFEDASEVKAAEGTLVGTWYVNASDPTDSFSEKYRKEYGEYPGWAAANAYDTYNLMLESVKKYGSDNAAIAQHLHTLTNYQGAAGMYSASGDNRFTLPGTLKIVTSDGFKKLDASKK